RAIGRRWARVTTQMGRGVDQLSPIGREEGARRAAAARRHQSRLATIVAHGEDLIAAEGRTRRLEDQPRARAVEVRLGVLAAEGELAQVRQMTLALIDCRRALWGRSPNPYDVAQCRARPDQSELRSEERRVGKGSRCS